MVLTKFRRIWHPEWCHGIKKGHFEGWYYKIVDSKEQNVIAFIPGYSFPKKTDIDSPHTFLQIIDGTNLSYHYLRYDLNDFWYNKTKFEVKIVSNTFSLQIAQFDVDKDGQKIKGKLSFEGIIPWPVKFLSPGATGPSAFIPRLQNYHGILSFNHRVSGSLSINGKEIDFTGGKGYIEKDWGKSHPQAWIWMQSNHFSDPCTSLTAAIGQIPFLGKKRTGLIAGLLLNSKLYPFTSYNGSKVIKLEEEGNIVHLTLQRKKYKLKIEAIQSEPIELLSPSSTGMQGKIKESLTSTINIKFSKKDKVIYEDTGRMAGLEWKGIQELV